MPRTVSVVQEEMNRKKSAAKSAYQREDDV